LKKTIHKEEKEFDHPGSPIHFRVDIEGAYADLKSKGVESAASRT
jgi:hypothetical protein